MVAKRVVSIGQQTFVLAPDGEVARTMVARLEEGGYQLLNGDDDRRPHWFSFKDAVAAASDRIGVRQTALRKALRALSQKRRALETKNYRDSVMNAPYRVIDLRDTMDLIFGRRRTRKLKKVHVPETYLMPGSVVYAIITPMTRSSELGLYRPHNHFVLETEVKSVCFSPDGKVHYTFSTPFVVEEFFPSRGEATTKLRSLLEPGSPHPVPFVSSKQEKEENKKLLDDDIPF